MTEIIEKRYREEDVFSKSQEDLRQFPARFEKSTLSRIEQISEGHGISKARVIRELVGIGLEEVKQ